ncbi:hypothetical protein [Flavobacterium sp. UGB4466]|uniref:hypothetical protein n=1 Tax=Flavobacterium sp. UGB4466 TaxID=2730889 RepID=UPI00192C869D|nr:hypothetical protein [Flavobacterium sp. UGB4466]
MKIKFIFLVVLLISNMSRSQITTTSALAPTFLDAGLGDLYLTSDTNQLYIGLSDGSLSLIGSGSWLLNGNSNATARSLLGTTNDIKVALKSNNNSLLELGRSSTLGLKYNSSNTNQYMAYLRRVGGVSPSLQFEVPAGTEYKPIFFMNTDGNFRLKGGAGTGFFEIGSVGAEDPNVSDGSLDFIIGDKGNEPIIFKKNSVTDGTSEMMRIQGQGSGSTSTVRVGIFTGGVVANSVLQVGGSFSLPIRAVTASTTLTDTDYTVVLKSGTYSGTGVTLPTVSTCKGRIYVIKNFSGADITISAYISRTGVSRTTLANNRIYSFQSDNVDWQQIK